MKGFSRKEPMFSLCGLNCALCARRCKPSVPSQSSR